jgi:hypothetical protein
MVTLIIILIINFLIAKLLITLTKKLSAIYVENSPILSSTIKKEQYEFFIKIYVDPKCLDNILILHIPFYNLICCHIVYMGILNAKNKLNGK